MTFADLYMFQALSAFSDPDDPFYVTLPEPISQRFQVMQYFPLLSDLVHRVGEVPGIRAWMATRDRGLF